MSRQIHAGAVAIGGGAPVTVQSMLNVPSTDVEGSVRQAKALEAAGCELIRAAVPESGGRPPDCGAERGRFRAHCGGHSL